MYMLEMLLVACGILAVQRALERPSSGRLAPRRAGHVALLVYTQYWAFYLVGVVGAGAARRRVARRRQRRAASLASRPRSSSACSRSCRGCRRSSPSARTPARRGATRAARACRSARRSSGSRAVRSRKAGCSSSCCCPLLAARPVRARRRRPSPRARPARAAVGALARVVGGATLVVGVDPQLPRRAGVRTALQRDRVPVLRAARRLAASSTLVDTRVQVAVVGVIVVLGLVGGVRNAAEQRTQAGQVGERARAEAQPGDLVVYCPDQLGPAVHRLAARRPRRGDVPGARRRPRSSTGSTTRSASMPRTRRRSRTRSSTRAGHRHDLARHRTRATRTTTARARRSRRALGRAAAAHVERVIPNEDYFEKPGLQQFASPAQ